MKSKTCFQTLFILACAAAPSLVAAEIKLEFPDASQHAAITQRVGLTDISLEYSRPTKRGREIFGGLVPYGQVWRTGANQPTKIKFSDMVKIGGQELPAGEYAFYSLPNENEWTIIFSRNTKLWGAYGYKAGDDALRVQVKPMTLATPVETFTISFDDLKNDGASLSLTWDKTRVPVEIMTNTASKVQSEIDDALKEPAALKPQFYYSAASFYYEHDKDLAQAAKWIDEAIAKQEPARYFMFYKKAQIEAKLGQKEEAKAAADKSIELLKAEPQPDESAIRNSQLLIDSLRRA
jgi:Protein of unknown function (DUF2911)